MVLERENKISDLLETLRKKDYLIYDLSGKSLKDLRKENPSFFASTWYTGSKQYDFEIQTSAPCKVAIKPDKFFLPESDNKNLCEQQDLIGELSQKKSLKYPGTSSKILEINQYAELTILHHQQNKKHKNLFKEKSIRTNTVFCLGTNPYNLCIGRFGQNGFVISSLSPNDIKEDFFAPRVLLLPNDQ